MLNDAMLQQSASQLLDLLSAGHFTFLQEPVYKLWGHQRPLIRHSLLFTRLQQGVFNVHQPAERDSALINISNSLCKSLRDHSPQKQHDSWRDFHISSKQGQSSQCFWISTTKEEQQNFQEMQHSPPFKGRCWRVKTKRFHKDMLFSCQHTTIAK